MDAHTHLALVWLAQDNQSVAGGGSPAAGDGSATGTVAPGGAGTGGGVGAGGAGGTGGGGAARPGGFEPLFLLVMLLVVGMIVISMMGQRRDRKKREAMISAIKKHDRVQTIGGVIGSVVEIKPDYVVLKVDEASNTRITFSRSAIAQVLTSTAEVGGTPKAEQPAT